MKLKTVLAVIADAVGLVVLITILAAFIIMADAFINATP